MTRRPRQPGYAPPVQVSIRLFAGLRERAGTGARRLELSGATLGDVWPALELGAEPAGLLYAVNRRYADAGTVLADGDEVALIPPVSGGDFRLTAEPLSLDAVVREVQRRGRRGRVLPRHRPQPLSRPRRPLSRVRGVRGHGRGDDGRAGARARGAPRAARGRDPPPARPRRDRRAERRDRGLLAAPAAALAACKEAIDTLKHTVPLWKKEVYEGGQEWIGQGS